MLFPLPFSLLIHLGSFSCQCHVGFRKMEADGSCNDVDECEEIAALCGHGDCQNLPGTYLCHCHPGFRLSDGTCDDINECQEEQKLCGDHGRCVNLVGTYVSSLKYSKTKIICQIAKSAFSSEIMILTTLYKYLSTYLLHKNLPWWKG